MEGIRSQNISLIISLSNVEDLGNIKGNVTGLTSCPEEE